MGRLVHFPRLPSAPPPPAAEPSLEVETPLWPVAGLVFVASLLRVAHAFWRHETFDTEPTTALILVLVLPWLALRRRLK